MKTLQKMYLTEKLEIHSLLVQEQQNHMAHEHCLLVYKYLTVQATAER